jgi:very-short-patch-repair endonuclease
MSKKLSGLHPWLRFKGHTQEQWVEWYGLDTEFIEVKAAEAYLEGEAIFFVEFDEAYGARLGARPDKQHILEKMRNDFAHAAINLCESPIEQRLLAALFWTGYGYRSAPVEIWDCTMPFGKPQTDVVIAPQYQIEKHRVDFAIFINGVANEEIKIVVECDGHDFHEKTKKQAARDKRRDRDLQIAGGKVLRFTGSEIWRDHEACAQQVDSLAVNEIEAQLVRRGLIKPRR